MDKKMLVVSFWVPLLFDIGGELSEPKFVSGYTAALPGRVGWLGGGEGAHWAHRGDRGGGLLSMGEERIGDLLHT